MQIEMLNAILGWFKTLGWFSNHCSKVEAISFDDVILEKLKSGEDLNSFNILLFVHKSLVTG